MPEHNVTFPQTPEEARVCIHFVKVWFGHECGLSDDSDEGYQWVSDEDVKAKLEYLRGELRAERISMGDLIDLQGMADLIEEGDVELLEAAGVPEFPDDDNEDEEYLEAALFMCTSEDRWLIGGQDTVDDPNDDSVVTCRHCGARASEVDGTVKINRAYRTIR